MSESVSDDRPEKARAIQRVILIEGLANFFVLVLKLVVGLSAGSLAVLGDAIHSLSDLANNFVAWFVIRLSNEPADREHPYGHRKFETLAVFGLAGLLTVLGFEIMLRAVQRDTAEIISTGWGVGLMGVVLVSNIALAWWENIQARRLGSDLLLADASHTFSDVLTTVVVIVGWQLSSAGYVWLDTLCAFGVACLVLYLAYGLFKRALPGLVDGFAIEPRELTMGVRGIEGVWSVKKVRSRWLGSQRAVDMIITVDPTLTIEGSHAIADRVEHFLEQEFDARDISIHVEPHQ
ncbi:MAG: cation diffusion facilitator family transporter [Gammaproteobacteria bacterium]